MILADLAPLSIGWRDIADIILVTLLLYQLILMIKGTRAITAIMGLIGIMILHFLSGFFGISTLNWLLDGFLSYLFLVVIIVFQRDIRAALNRMGSHQRWFFRKDKNSVSPVIQEICKATQYLSKHRIGALIVFERGTPLGDVTEKAVQINATVTSELICTIFWPGSPLHDGAMVVNSDKIAAGGCILPLASGVQGKQDYGTRHRAALGITEETDAVVIVVSEEKGSIRIAVNGHLSGLLEGQALQRSLSAVMEKRRTS